MRRNQGFSGSVDGPFRMGLYRMEVQARDLRQNVEVRFLQWQVGWQRDDWPNSPL